MGYIQLLSRGGGKQTHLAVVCQGDMTATGGSPDGIKYRGYLLGATPPHAKRTSSNVRWTGADVIKEWRTTFPSPRTLAMLKRRFYREYEKAPTREAAIRAARG